MKISYIESIHLGSEFENVLLKVGLLEHLVIGSFILQINKEWVIC